MLADATANRSHSAPPAPHHPVNQNISNQSLQPYHMSSAPYPAYQSTYSGRETVANASSSIHSWGFGGVVVVIPLTSKVSSSIPSKIHFNVDSNPVLM